MNTRAETEKKSETAATTKIDYLNRNTHVKRMNK